MKPEIGKLGAGDAGLAALVTLLRFHGIGADQEQIRHQCGGVAIGVPEMLRMSAAATAEFRSHDASVDPRTASDPTKTKPRTIRDDSGFACCARTGT